MTTYIPCQGQFENDVSQHSLTILFDQGLYRHLRFMRNSSSAYHFDIITYPGGLLYRGDMGTFVFERTQDMLKFFRDEGECEINPEYWAEKVTADCRSGVTTFCNEAFEKAVIGDLIQWIRETRGQTTPQERRRLWDAVVDDVISQDGEHRKVEAAHEFVHDVNAWVGFEFTEFSEHDLTKFTHRFIWCCRALVWGIGLYRRTVATAVKSIT